MRFNLVHILLESPFHGPIGYRETIETLEWGLRQLGHDVRTQVNAIDPDRTNIVVGAQLIPPEEIPRLPASTIIYNLEQIASLQPHQVKRAVRDAAARFQFWDYSKGNIDCLRRLEAIREPVHVPIGWAPLLERIDRPAVHDIDVLIYGMPSQPRMQTMFQLIDSGVSLVYGCGVYGTARDALIARAKLIVNVKGVPQSNVFEVVRVSYLLANAKAVVSDIYPDSVVDDDLRDAVKFVPVDQIADTCKHLLADDEERAALGARGLEIIRRRDIRAILRHVVPAAGTANS